MKDPFDFKNWLNNAFLDVIKKSIETLAGKGLVNNHHFYINFNTNHKFVVIENTLLQQYPKEITIVIQNQYSNVYVNEIGFGITLMFGGKPSAMFIPWSAINSFYNPAIGLNLDVKNFILEENHSVEDDIFFKISSNPALNPNYSLQEEEIVSITTNKSKPKSKGKSAGKSKKTQKDSANVIEFPKF